MLKSAVIAHFGSPSAAAHAIHVTPQAVNDWDEIVPEGSAYKYQVVTNGKLKVDPKFYPPRSKRRQNSSVEGSV